MKLVTSSRYKKVTNLTLAFVLAISSVTAALPFAFSKEADAAPIAACTSVSNVHSTSLSGWDKGDTRATGHHELMAGGLHVWTEGSTSTDKVAGYHASDFALANAGTPSISYSSNQGGLPGLQMVTDFDNDGTTDGILVGETIYNGDWWLNNEAKQFAKDGAPLHTGGSGSANHGTLEQWLDAFPSARVKAVGFSLGSGVKGDHVITSLEFGCVSYTFGLAAPSSLTPADTTYTSDPSFDNTWSAVEGAAKYGYTATYSLNGGMQTYSDTSDAGNYVLGGQTITRYNNQAPNSTYSWYVYAIDSKGNRGPSSATHTVTVDTQAPTAPVVTYPKGWNQSVSTIKWTAATDATPLAYDIYEGSHPTNVNNLIAANVTGTSYDYSFATGPHWIRVVAKDAVGLTVSSASEPFRVIGTPEVTSPASNKALNTLNGDRTLNIKWNSVDGVGGVKNYELELGADRNHDGIIQADEVMPRTVRGNEQNYVQQFTTDFQGVLSVRVRAVYNIAFAGSDKGPWSQVVNYSRDTVAPAVPRLTAPETSRTNTVAVNWSSVSDATGYVLESYGNASYTEGSLIERRTLSSSVTSTTYQGMSNGTYYLRIAAIDAAGHSSNWAYVTMSVDVSAPEQSNNGGSSAGGAGPDAGDNGDSVTLNGTDNPTSNRSSIVPLFASPASILGVTTGTGNNITGVDSDDADDAEVRGASTSSNSRSTAAQAADTDANDGTLWGLAWYWWVLIAAALALLIGGLVRMVRGRADA